MKKLTPKQKHTYAGYGLTAIGEACNLLGMQKRIKSDDKLNSVVAAIGVTASITSIANFIGSLYIFDDEDNEKDVFISHLATMVLFPIVDIYCLASSLKK